MQNLRFRAAKAVVVLLLVRALVAFLAAGTFRYWQAWTMLAIMAVGESATSRYLARRDPALLERRLTLKEGDERQSKLAAVGRLSFLGAIAISALDHRMGGSSVPPTAWVLGYGLIALGLFLMWLAFRANTFASATVEVIRDQHLVSHGPYASVRHPMYSGLIVMFVGIPLAMDSLWGLVPAGLATAIIVLRLLEEERFLAGHLAGYAEYRDRVRYRVAPMVW